MQYSTGSQKIIVNSTNLNLTDGMKPVQDAMQPPTLPPHLRHQALPDQNTDHVQQQNVSSAGTSTTSEIVTAAPHSTPPMESSQVTPLALAMEYHTGQTPESTVDTNDSFIAQILQHLEVIDHEVHAVRELIKARAHGDYSEMNGAHKAATESYVVTTNIYTDPIPSIEQPVTEPSTPVKAAAADQSEIETTPDQYPVNKFDYTSGIPPEPASSPAVPTSAVVPTGVSSNDAEDQDPATSSASVKDAIAINASSTKTVSPPPHLASLATSATPVTAIHAKTTSSTPDTASPAIPARTVNNDTDDRENMVTFANWGPQGTRTGPGKPCPTINIRSFHFISRTSRHWTDPHPQPHNPVP